MAAVSYSLNFIWLNYDAQCREEDTAQNIFELGDSVAENDPLLADAEAFTSMEASAKEGRLSKEEDRRWKALNKSRTYTLVQWAAQHRHARISLWFDSAIVTERALKNSATMLRDASRSWGVDLRLKDLRQLPLEGELLNAMHVAIPVYFRVDLLKALIVDHAGRQQPHYCVILDFDIPLMSTEELFDEKTIKFLDGPGYVFNVGFENNFYIFNSAKTELIEQHRKHVLDDTAKDIKRTRDGVAHLVSRYERPLDSTYIYFRYFDLLRILDTGGDPTKYPRKNVHSGISKFYITLYSKLPDDTRREAFRFVGDSNVPHITLSNNPWESEDYHPEYEEWQAVPLTLEGNTHSEAAVQTPL